MNLQPETKESNWELSTENAGIDMRHVESWQHDNTY